MTSPLGLACLLALACAAAATGPSSGTGYAAPKATGYAATNSYNKFDIETIGKLVEVLNNEAQILVNTISNGNTLLAAAQDKLNLISDRLIPQVNLRNNQQDDTISNARTQIAGLQERVDAADAVVEGADSVADDTAESIESQRIFLQNTIVAGNVAQDDLIFSLQNELAEEEGNIVEAINQAVSDLGDYLATATGSITDLAEVVDSRKCEYGTAAIGPGAYQVYFKTQFDEAPSVTLVVPGFQADLDVKSYGSYDNLALDKHAYDVTKEGFSVSNKDLSDGMVMVDTVYCSWMACQNLGQQPKAGYV